MNPIIVYMVKTSVYLTGFYIVYYLFLSKDTMYARNRLYIIGSLVFSIILPFISFRIGSNNTFAFIGKTLSGILVTADKTISDTLNNPAQLNLNNSILLIYLFGTGVMVLKLLFDILYLLNLINHDYTGGEKVINIEGINTSGFSALGFIFINRSVTVPEMHEIIRHEATHLRHKHYIDILLIGFIKTFQWFNPIIYFMDRSLRAIHEYQADVCYLETGLSVAGYQSLLVNHTFRTKTFIASNTFSNPSLLKKRMIMMTKKRSGSLANIKLLIVLPVVALLMAGISACTMSKHSTGNRDKNVQSSVPSPMDIFVVVEEMPVYPGGDKALMEFIYKNLEYPKEAKDKGIQGRAICRFAIMSDGTVDNVSVMKGVDPLLDSEAIRVLKLMNNWQPGKQGGKPVNVWYSVPITFQLK